MSGHAVPQFDELLRRIGDLKEAAEAAVAEQRLEAGEIAVLRQRLARLHAAFRRLEASTTRAQEGEVRARSNLEDALRTSRAKTHLLAALGHDLRQPLTVIVGALETLETELPPNRRRMMERAKVASARIERALGSLMEAAQLEYGAIKPHIHPFPIDALLTEICDQHEPDAERKGLRLTMHACLLEVVSDPALLGGILHNLIENAIKYTNTGGIRVECHRRSDILSVEVSDSGIGIPDEMLGVIFDEYQQIAPGTGTGVGLGLFIVKRSADLLGHRLIVHSKLGEGSCFAVQVPVNLAPGRAGEIPDGWIGPTG
jgi:signal transduction histidine kinase